MRSYTYFKNIFLVLTIGFTAALAVSCGAQKGTSSESKLSNGGIGNASPSGLTSELDNNASTAPRPLEALKKSTIFKNDETTREFGIAKPPQNIPQSTDSNINVFDLKEFELLRSESLDYADHNAEETKLRSYPLRFKFKLFRSRLTGKTIVKFTWNLTDIDEKMSIVREDIEGSVTSDYQVMHSLRGGFFVDDTLEPGPLYQFKFNVDSKSKGVSQFHITTFSVPERGLK